MKPFKSITCRSLFNSSLWLLLLLNTVAVYASSTFNASAPVNKAIAPRLISPFSTQAKTWWFSLRLGENYPITPSHQQVIAITPAFNNTYLPKNSQNVLKSIGLQFGIEYPLRSPVALKIAGELDYLPGFAFTGAVWQFADPTFNDLTYHYKVDSLEAFTTLTLSFHWHYPITPYLLAAIGLAHNRTYDYHETSVKGTATPMTPFTNKTHDSLAYAVGMGVALNVTPTVSVNIEYRYLNMGTASLGPSPEQTTSQSFVSQPIFTHQVWLGFIWQL